MDAFMDYLHQKKQHTLRHISLALWCANALTAFFAPPLLTSIGVASLIDAQTALPDRREAAGAPSYPAGARTGVWQQQEVYCQSPMGAVLSKRSPVNGLGGMVEAHAVY